MLKLFGNIYGKKILSGQHNEFNSVKEINYIKKISGKEPAVCGFDFIFYTENSHKGETEKAIEWHKKGGIVTFQWHWNAPMGGPSFGTDKTSFDISKAVTSGTEENKAIMKDLDKVAVEIKKLSDANVPFLFRPLHEAEGGWFWWGRDKKPEPCKKLWKIMFDYYTNHYKFNNILWTWNQNTDPNFNWYPGDNYLDILSTDIYKAKFVYDSWFSDYKKLSDYIKGKKFIALTENGPIPDPDKCLKDGANWLLFATWWGDFIDTSKYISASQIKKVYNHSNVVTLDEMEELWASVGVQVPGEKHNNHHKIYPPRLLPDRKSWIIPAVSSKGYDLHLSIFDLSGRCVRDIIFINSPADQVDLHWDGNDDNGGAIKPGAYVYSIRANGIISQSAVINVSH